jgi:uncharacterized repeat protein (TIGR01451 family)
VLTKDEKMYEILCNYKNKLTALIRHKNRLNGQSAALLLAVLVLYSGFSIAWTPYNNQNRTVSNPYSQNSTAAMEPDVVVNAITPENVTYGQIFNLAVTVKNSGNVAANDVHLLYKASPPGFFIVQNVDQPACALGQDSEDVSLGTLNSNDLKEINFMLQVPTKEQVANVWSKNFRFDFTISYDKSVRSYAGCVELLIRHGKLLLSKKGFSGSD